MIKKKKSKITYASWDELKNDREQQAIYKEIADINAYIQKKLMPERKFRYYLEVSQ